MGQRLSILIADSNPLDRLGFASICRTHLHIRSILEAESLSAVEALISTDRPIALGAVALDLPGLSGDLRKLRELQMRIERFPLVVIGPSIGGKVLRDVLATGADGYVSKAMQIPEISAALHAVLSGYNFMQQGSPSALQIGPGRPSGGKSRIEERFTKRQLQVLELMVEGLSNKMIARHLSIAESTVKVHVNAAFHILGVHSRKNAIAALTQMEAASRKDDPILLRILNGFRSSQPARSSSEANIWRKA